MPESLLYIHETVLPHEYRRTLTPHYIPTVWSIPVSYTHLDIDTVCEDEELITAGSNLLSDQEDNLLLSYVDVYKRQPTTAMSTLSAITEKFTTRMS